eukprot:TRINITY_DN65691_c0_g1_i1.p1 TRINITY_DN65691_c0_g1~~TRINITY_DN65691_c0_g1_i1.p1  ORF type:complete len:357 (+),score=37.62 TRINITY_DN65691_c0_g1_i1:60-1130(+)
MNSPAEGSGDKDVLNVEDLIQRHKNRQVLLGKLNSLKGQIRQLERQVEEIEHTVKGLPYETQRQSQAEEPPTGRRCSFLANAIAGGIALPLAISCSHPIDTVRVMMQAAIAEEQGFSKVVRSLGLRGFMRGIGMSALWACPQGAIRLGVYESSKETLAGTFDVRALNVSVSAIVGDMASSVVKVPRELVTQQLQVGHNKSALSAAQSIVSQDGPMGLFRGYWSTCARDAPFMVVLFFSYEQFKSWKIRLTFATHGPAQMFSPWSDVETILWGGISGAIAAFVTTPFDVIKTRIMTSQKRLTISSAVRGIPINDMFLGAGPRSAWWFGVCSIFFATYERLRLLAQDGLHTSRQRIHG